MQPELFQDLPSAERPKRLNWPAFPGRFLRIKVAYEDLIFGVLSVILLFLAGYCLGVERGKHLVAGPEDIASPQLVARAGEGVSDVASPQVSPAVPERVLQERVNEQTVQPASTPSQRESDVVPAPQRRPAQRYVIQLASYVGAQSARDEAARLRRKGIDVRVIQQGRYYELRAIGYRSRQHAQASLGTLRKRYRDAFIKRLSSG